jgi:hypothetical protein
MSDRLPPQPLSENLWGDDWQFAVIGAADLPDLYHDRMIPIVQVDADRAPLKLGLASDLPIPGVVINGGRRSRQLAQWLQQVQPVLLQAIVGEPDGLILFAGPIERWILTTWADEDVRQAGLVFEARKQRAKGLHFLLVQPDDSGMTYSGFWLLSALGASV